MKRPARILSVTISTAFTLATVTIARADPLQLSPGPDQARQKVVVQNPKGVSIAAIKAALLRYRSQIWKDPDSVREVRIGTPYSCYGDYGNYTCVCIEANSKNSFGGYTGLQRTELLFQNADAFQIMDVVSPYSTKCGQFSSFPAMNAVRK